MTSKRYSGIAVFLLVVVITYLHYTTVHALESLHDIYRAFYYLPVFIAALIFGLKGAFLTYLLILILYLPYIYISWTGTYVYEADRLLHLFLQGTLAVVAGFLIDRDRRRREQLEKERYLAGIGQVATTIVHDLKNPLITILGFSRRILEGKGRVDTAAQTIMDSAGKMQKIVNDVLDFAKPLKLDLKEEDMREVIKRVYDLCKTKADGQGVSLSVDLPVGPAVISIDAFQLERAVVNLVNNAIEASGREQSIMITAKPEKEYLAVTIRDEGMGMDGETLENIFTPFYTRKGSGTGLGTSISKKIIEEHEGMIYISSQPGTGTEVTIRLPFKAIAEKKK
jgi:two-component system sensor histidine kinase HydH